MYSQYCMHLLRVDPLDVDSDGTSFLRWSSSRTDEDLSRGERVAFAEHSWTSRGEWGTASCVDTPYLRGNPIFGDIGMSQRLRVTRCMAQKAKACSAALRGCQVRPCGRRARGDRRGREEDEGGRAAPGAERGARRQGAPFA